MLNEDCLNVRLGDYLDRRRNPSPNTEAEAASDEDDAQQDCEEGGDG